MSADFAVSTATSLSLPTADARRPPVSVTSAFDSGNILLVGLEGDTVRLRIAADPFTPLEGRYHMQWFAFRSTLLAGETDAVVTTYAIDNAGLCSYASAWDGAEVCVSYDRASWHRVPTTRYDAAIGTLSWEWRHTSSQPTAYFAYFDMYPYERHLDLVARCTEAMGAPGLRVASLGQSLESRDIERITVGRGPLQAWVIHRQHPGESQASFFAEGLLNRLLGLDSGGAIDGLAARMLASFTWHIVPLMNPDGVHHGYLRTNAAGANLNREWAPTSAVHSASGLDYMAPTPERSPEVHHVLAAMELTGVDFFLDVHGDEGLPFGFLAGNEGIPNWGPRLRALHGAFVGAYARANPDMQAAFGYTPDPPQGSNPAVGADQVGRRFDCLAAIIEMPFKDNAANPEARRGDRGFDGHRCAMLGASLLDAVAYVQTSLRDVTEPRFQLSDDAYIRPIEDMAEVEKFVMARAVAATAAGAPAPQPSPPSMPEDAAKEAWIKRLDAPTPSKASSTQTGKASSAVDGSAAAPAAQDGSANLWQSAAQREHWYERGKAYWEWAAPTNDGVVSGIGPLHDADIGDSLQFLIDGDTPLWPQPTFRAGARALDIGAGIGRVSGALLLHLCGEVDLVDGSAAHLDQAHASFGGAPKSPDTSRGRVGNFLCADLQNFVPSRSYDLIWIQWTTMYLTDDDLRRLLRDCQRALAPEGFIVLKDNVIDVVKGPKGLVDGRYMVDEEDASVSRTRDHLLHLISEVGMSVVASMTANLESEELAECLSVNGWEEMHPVAMLAIR